jgi:acetone carboxylase gamma subunit
MQIHEYLELDIESNTVSCMECGEELCAGDENYKRHAALKRLPVHELGPAFSPAEEILGEETDLELRRYACPGCGILLDHIVAKEDDDIIHDIDIDVEKLRS